MSLYRASFCTEGGTEADICDIPCLRKDKAADMRIRIARFPLRLAAKRTQGERVRCTPDELDAALANAYAQLKRK